MYINNHVLSGNVTRDAVLRDAGDTKVLSFGLANNSPFKDKNTTFYNVSLFGRQAETLASMVTKGVQIVVVGETSQREYTDKNGNTQKSLDFRASSVQLASARNQNDEAAEDADEDVDNIF